MQEPVKLDANGMTPEEVKVLADMDARTTSQTEEIKAPPQQTPVDWEKRYKDLEKEYQKTKDSLKTPTTPEAPKTPETPVDDSDKFIREVENEYLENGKLSEETYAKIKTEKNLGKTEVDLIISGKKAEAEAVKRDVLSVLGSDKPEETYTKLIDWARENYSQEERQTFDKVISESGSPVLMKQQLELMKMRFERSNGSISPEIISGTRGSSSETGLYESHAELRKDLSDPRYNTNSAFRDMVEKKAARSLKNL